MNNYRVLVADDKKIVRESIAKFVENEIDGFTVVGCFSDGSEVIDYICNNNVDVVVTDIKMHTVSGIDIAKYIYENELEIEIILISAYKYFEYARQALQYGVRDYLLKPTSVVQLEKSFSNIKTVLDKRVSANSEKQEKEQGDSLLKTNNNQRDDVIIQKAIDYIKKNYMNPISLQDVAKSVYLSEFYFSKFFKRKTNKNFTDYLVEVRMEKALELLKSGNYKVNEISKLVGYESNYFVKIFKNYTGYTPREYMLFGEKSDE